MVSWGSSSSKAAECRTCSGTRSPNRGDGVVLDLARTYQLTPYDAAYHDLAIGSGLALATADKALAAAARASNVTLLVHLAP